MDDSLITIQEAAKMLGIRPVTLRKWDREGKLRAVRIGTRRDRKYRQLDILAFMEQPIEQHQAQPDKFEWFLIQERGDNIPLLPAVQPMFEEYTISPQKLIGAPNQNAIMYFEHGGVKYYGDINEWQTTKKYALKKIREEPEYMQNLLDNYKKNLPKLDQVNQEIKAFDLSKYTNRDLWQVFDKYYQVYKEVYVWSEPYCIWLSEPLTDYLEEYLREILRERHQEKLFSQDFEILITSKEIPFTTKEERSLLDIAIAISEDNRLVEIFKNGDNNTIQDALKNYSKVDQMINRHQEEFEWVPFDYGSPIWDKGHFIKAITEIFKSGFKIENRMKTIDNFYSDISIKQEKLFAELNIDKYHQNLFKALQADTQTIDYKKEQFTKSHFIAKRLMDEIKKRFDFTDEQIYRLSYDDVKKILIDNQKPNLSTLEHRWERMVVHVYNGTCHIMEGEKALKFIEDHGLTKKELKESKEVKGITASGGRAIGIVKVITNPKEFSKMETGDVLITYMTTPEYVPILRKAAAIVTNEGGITCHAAIVSRELNIPCIVGTKNATDVFKDGDKIEVRANHGVARKVE